MGAVKFKLSLADINDYYFEEDEEISLRAGSKNEKREVSLKGLSGDAVKTAVERKLSPFGPENDAGLVYGWLCGITKAAAENYVDMTGSSDEKKIVGNFVEKGQVKNLISAVFERVGGEWYVRDLDIDVSSLGDMQGEDLSDADTATLIRNELKKHRLTEKNIKVFLRGLTLEEFVDMTYDELQKHTNRKYKVKNGSHYRTKTGKKRIKYDSTIRLRRASYIAGEQKEKPLVSETTGRALIDESLVGWLLKVIERIAEGREKKKATDAARREAAARLEGDIAAKRKAVVREIERQSDILMRTFGNLKGEGFSPLNPGVMNIRTAKKPLSIPSLSADGVREALGADALVVRAPAAEKKTGKKTMEASVTYSGAEKNGAQGIRLYRFAPLVVSACQTVKGKFDLMHGCIMMAAYFQILVSNTPVDEDYVFLEERLSSYKRKTDRGLVRTDRKTGAVEPKGQTQLSTYIAKRKHTADKVSVRGDWVLNFRGKTFKAYDSEPEKGSLDVSPDVYFGEELFDRGVDTGSIMRIAEMIMDATGRELSGRKLAELEAERLDPTKCVTNVNPRWQILETGGYTRNPSTKSPRKGSRYGLEHGTRAGFTYQAPKGFVRLTNALWSSLAETGKWADIAVSFMEGRQDEVRSLLSLDASDTSSPLVRKLARRDRNIGRAGFSARELEGGK